MSLQLWVLQSNVNADHEEDLRSMIEVLQGLTLSWAAIPLRPFEGTLPKIEWDGPRVFYGSTKMVELAGQKGRQGSHPQDPGVRPEDPFWYSPHTFRPSVWGHSFGHLWLNAGADFLTVRKFLSGLGGDLWSGDSDLTEIFMRPDADLKDFVGRVVSYRDAPKYLVNVQPDIRMLVATPKVIHSETRCWMVDGQVVAAVGYRQGGKRVVRVYDPIPESIRVFAMACAGLCSPAPVSPVFVLDVAETDDGMRVIEINSFHASGFYSTQTILPVVRAVSNYVAKNYY